MSMTTNNNKALVAQNPEQFHANRGCVCAPQVMR
ncbi:hypothetical protein F441_08238 [Phytophthora nicotianae CJ01A1]|uniref:Uncharacterized protein n=2 Tax=Phytophthora nicotianae TaxID=4792 RepID=W2Q9N2_PHYN3|nr:hypothetical protein PPTG_22851 [Phytophthora nicotianae INRA-310]ETN09878.1 hypothetical protein PPTG_22851 [Phytophthora nicotianae INRA-310]ETP17335.1 hypothetical protein F441_08238 [Phytophthora nicotianae CJ01A1]